MRSRRWTPRLVQTRAGLVGFVALGLLLAFVIAGPLIAPHEPDAPIGIPGEPPGNGLLLGTDGLGRDVLSRLLHGGLTALGFAAAATAVSYGIGVTVGLTAGYARNWLDGLLMRGVDVLLAFPPLLFALVVITGAGTSAPVLIIAVGMIQMPGISRLVRAVTLEVSVRGYVEAAEARGERMPAILRREILPSISGPILADFGLRFGYAIILIASLNFLGLGLAPPAADWGLMIAENREIISLNVWAVLAPALTLAALTIAVNLVADGFVSVQGRSTVGSPNA
jgi:ABC-type dipeptide/oligopeptide/nickel transport system permease subunit